MTIVDQTENYSLMRKKPELSIFKNCISEMFSKMWNFNRTGFLADRLDFFGTTLIKL